MRFSQFGHKPFQKQVIFPGDMFGRLDNMVNKNIALSDVHTFSPTLINELRVGVVRQAFTFCDANFGQDYPRKLGYPSNVPDDVIPTIGITGFTSSATAPAPRGSLNWNFEDMVTKVHGNHSMKLGAQHRLLRGNNRNRPSNHSVTSLSPRR